MPTPVGAVRQNLAKSALTRNINHYLVWLTTSGPPSFFFPNEEKRAGLGLAAARPAMPTPEGAARQNLAGSALTRNINHCLIWLTTSGPPSFFFPNEEKRAGLGPRARTGKG